ncbi:HAD-IA family hydrolase [Castellaniella sp. GW247-6E4]|uniref:HAD-IA family hydrolase n=1 Tax=Castellaniella sp. GW247-6E4 TaxID=3140380 RepID=UPI0033161AEC
MKTYRAVIFDWDGTLMDSTQHIVAALRSACADLGLPLPSVEEASWVIGLSIEAALYRLVPDLTSERMEAFAERYRAHFLSQDREQQLFPGQDAFLRGLHQRGVVLGVATGKSRRGLDRALDALALREVFQATRCADEAAGKPDPAMLEQLLHELSLEPFEVVMVGDTTHDVLMARYAGVDSLAVSYGAHSRKELGTAEPTALASSVGDMQAWLLART